MVVNVEFLGGETIENAVTQALAFATRNECFVAFSFNGVDMLISKLSFDPMKDIECFVSEYHAKTNKA